MPALLNNQLFPVTYAPWYVKDARLVAVPAAFDKYDILVPTAGRFNRAATDAVLVGGYVIATEQFQTGVTEVQVALPGSLIPFVAGGALQPNSLVKIVLTTNDGMRAVACTAADLAAGRCLGRFRNHQGNHINLRAAAANDIIHVATGVI